jgi:hypothetical protein
MNKQSIQEAVTEASRALLASQPDLFRFTSETHQTEWNIAHHLANELHRLFHGYDCDLDVSKPNLGDRRPDIVIHRRGGHEENLLVVEVKRSRGDVAGEIEKIRNWWFPPPLRYRYGAVVVVNEGAEPFIEVIPNESCVAM